MEQELAQLKARVAELIEWKRQRELHAVPYPLDEASKFTIFQDFSGVEVLGTGATALTQSVAVASTPTNITVPKAYSDTVLLKMDGTTYEVPYLALNP